MSYPDLYPFFKNILFQLPAECSHNLSLWALKHAGNCLLPSLSETENKGVQIANLFFPNKVGLAAGLDKQAECIPAWQRMGFGFIELGTVVPKPQIGNPKPRLFRHRADKAIINRFGFNSCGIEKFVENLTQFLAVKKGLWGINIGKNKDTDNDLAYQDYVFCLEKAYFLADYVTINISSPNTQNLRALQQADSLAKLLEKVLTARMTLEKQFSKYVPIFVKLSPDLSQAELKEMVRVFLEFKIDGLITTNTTVWRPQNSPQKFYQEVGGLSGEPVFKLSLDTLKYCADLTSGSLPIIASGGIDSVEKAKLKLAAGASLLQIYTGLIYEGPKLVQDLVREL